jgi:pimeloyl-ACP methyl ester carboxylesterase
MSSASSPAPGAPNTDPSGKPTIVLVHGAWADSSSWGGVIQRLRADGFPLRAVANPLQGLNGDTAYLASILATIDGPVVLVGHSYGGALISNLDAAAFDLRALVYVAGFIPARGETVGQLASQSSPPLPLVAVDVPGGAEVGIDPAAFRDAFAGDLDAEAAAGLAVVQRPANTKAVSEAATHEAYRTVPAWMLVTRQDQAISPSLQLLMAHRADARIIEVDASHAVMVSRPDVVADVIEQAAREVDVRLHA